jgi:uncharacterized protein YcnI
MAWRPGLFLSLLPCCLLVASPVAAHVGFAKRQVALAASLDLTLRVPHGCDGSPTLRLRMRIPRAVASVRPQPKEGWSVAQTGEGGAREVIWSGNLPDKQTGEFSFTITFEASAKAGDTIHFPVVQECAKGVSRWIDIKGAEAPAEERHDESSSPAPAIKLLPPK